MIAVPDEKRCLKRGICVEATVVALTSGQRFVSRTRYGPAALARLGIAEENSAELVSLTTRIEAEAVISA
ncbi:MAG: hypothetical protein JXA30_22175 [Deltaproteobacteria bacterium]|nr:hypothetical protein [Deltaproteobacteria bacterium]